MSNFTIPYIALNQNSQEFLIASMPFKCIDLFSKVLVYGIDENGYQRKPEPKHYNKIRDYVINNPSSFKLPTSIILGIDKEDLKKISSKNIITLDTTKTRNDIFRIVDGQHRIYGLREAAQKEKNINEFPLPVTIVVTSPKSRSIELEIFTDINSKSKRIKIDLIKLAEYDYRLKEKSLTEKNLLDDIAIQISYDLKENNEQSVWHNAIKFDIHNEYILGIVGVNTFMESVDPIVKYHLKRTPIVLTQGKYEGVKRDVNNVAESISKMLFECWDNIIKNKWSDAFDVRKIEMDIDEELRYYFYKKDYYIQKTLGVKVLNGIISEIYKEFDGSIGRTIQNFKTRIFKSKIKVDDWRTGKLFAGFSSESGFKKVRDMI